MERELNELAAQGQAAAFSELLRRHLPCLYDFCARLQRDPDAARDLLSEVMAELAREPGAIALGEGFRAVALKLLLDKSVGRRRSTGGLAAETLVLNAPVSDAFCRSSMSLQHGAEFDAGMAVLVWQVAATLDRRQFAVLDLWTRQGLNPHELAQVLGLSSSSVAATAARMEKSVDETMRAIILSQRGRRWCHELDGLLVDEDRMRIDEELRRRIGNHVETCTSCLQTAVRLPSGLQVYGSLQPVAAPPGLRSALMTGALPSLNGDGSEAIGDNQPPVVSTSGRIEPLQRGLRIEGTLHPTRHKPSLHVPRFRASRVRLGATEPAEEAYSYEYSDQRAAPREERRFLFLVLGGLAIVGLLGLMGLLYVSRDDGDAEPTVAAENTLSAVATEQAPNLSLSAAEVDFGSDQVSRVLTLETVAEDQLTWTLEADQAWLAVNPDAGSIAAGESLAIEVSVDREALAEGLHEGSLVLADSDGEESQIPVELVVPGTGPTISDQRLNLPADEDTGALYIFKSGCEPQPTAFRVSAAIVDPSGVEVAQIIYTVGQDQPLTIAMEESATDRWEGSIPPLTRDGPLLFHIEATDTAANTTASQPVTVELRDCGNPAPTP